MVLYGNLLGCKFGVSIAFGVLQILCGLFDMVAAGLAIACYTWAYDWGTGFWCGTIFIISGSVAISAAYRPMLMIFNSIVNSIAMFFAALQLAIGIYGLCYELYFHMSCRVYNCEENWFFQCYGCGDDFYYTAGLVTQSMYIVVAAIEACCILAILIVCCTTRCGVTSFQVRDQVMQLEMQQQQNYPQLAAELQTSQQAYPQLPEQSQNPHLNSQVYPQLPEQSQNPHFNSQVYPQLPPPDYDSIEENTKKEQF